MNTVFQFCYQIISYGPQSYFVWPAAGQNVPFTGVCTTKDVLQTSIFAFLTCLSCNEHVFNGSVYKLLGISKNPAKQFRDCLHQGL